MRVLRCLREFKKWSWLGKIGKNEEKMRKMAVPKSANIHYYSSIESEDVLEQPSQTIDAYCRMGLT